VRLGILGGTFDPPHIGHLLAASDAIEALALDRLWLIPNATQPLKGESHGSASQRLHMVRLLADGDARFGVDSIEIDRAGLSFSVDTLAAYAERYPAADRHFLIGADVLPTLAHWREPERVRELAQLVVLERVAGEADGTAMTHAAGTDGSRPVVRLTTRRVDVSSTEIRARVAAGLPIHGFVPDAIRAYIAASGLYLERTVC
jgi:nicotinate-nucleotide adenylyltransferase